MKWSAALIILSVALRSAEASTPPNILLLLADDLGYGDITCYGGSAVPTPRIDALARRGMRFTGYCDASAVCSPTRASLLTGRYPLRFGITRHFSDGPEHLPAGTPTVPRLLKTAGYSTMHIGKWHLGGLRPGDVADRLRGLPGPREHGFDHYLAMYEGPEIRQPLVKSGRLYRDGTKHLLRDDQPVDLSPRHLTDAETDEAERALATFSKSRAPFYLQVWFDTPHKPYEPASDAIMRTIPGEGDSDERLYRGMIAHLDASVGRILDKLAELGLAENTLVIFSSDNGPTGPGGAGGWRGGKGTLYEGGMRVPFIASWPNHVKEGSRSDSFALSTDLLPTFCEIAGVGLPGSYKADGQSLAPLLLGKDGLAERGAAFWKLDEYANFHTERGEPRPFATEAVRSGSWKLLARDGVPLELFDLSRDPQEKTSILEANREKAEALAAQLRTWLSEPRGNPVNN